MSTFTLPPWTNMAITWGVIVVIVLFFIRSKRGAWFKKSRTYTPPLTGTGAGAQQPAPPQIPQQEPRPTAASTQAPRTQTEAVQTTVSVETDRRGRTRPYWKWVKWVLGVIFLSILLKTGSYLSSTISFSEYTKSTDLRGLTPVTVPTIPTAVALRAICECESGCQHLKDGKINTNDTSGAFGKYQFLEIHREPARKVGFKDLNNEADQDGYAAHLYEKEGGFRHWNFEGTPKCLAAKLGLPLGSDGKLLAENPTMVTYPAEVEAPPKEPSEVVTIPLGFRVNWGGNEGAFTIINQDGQKATYDPKKKVFEDLPIPTTAMKFQAIGEKPIKVKLVFSKY